MFWCQICALLILLVVATLTRGFDANKINSSQQRDSSMAAEPHDHKPRDSLFTEAICLREKEAEFLSKLASSIAAAQPQTLWKRVKTALTRAAEKERRREQIVEALKDSEKAENFFEHAANALNAFKEFTGKGIRSLMLAAILKEFALNFESRARKIRKQFAENMENKVQNCDDSGTMLKEVATILAGFDSKLSTFMSPQNPPTTDENIDDRNHELMSNLLGEPLQQLGKLLAKRFLLQKLDNDGREHVCTAFKLFVKVRLLQPLANAKKVHSKAEHAKVTEVLDNLLKRCHDLDRGFV